MRNPSKAGKKAVSKSIIFKEKMATSGLLFIPDISGFTRFINKTEIEHSSLIIQELLELLINANETGLEISEIEGDAILFYKYGSPPAPEVLYRQVEKMFCEFHRNLKIYEETRFCQCAACVSASNLTLKVITHYGEFTSYTVKNFNKLIGKDVIVAHQLLKNDIDQHEYWLITDNLLKEVQPSALPDTVEWENSTKHTENGSVPFQYALLSKLKDRIATEPIPPPDLSRMKKVFSATDNYSTDIITMFHATGAFNYRHQWREGVVRVEEVNHFLPRVGMQCRTILKNGSTTMYAASYRYSPERIEFTETDDSHDHVTYYLLEKVNRHVTKFTLEYYIPATLLSRIRYYFGKKRVIKREIRTSMVNLHGFVKDLYVDSHA